MRFEWDDEKNKENIRKHGLDFSDARELFDAPMLVNLDTGEDYGEDRWIGVRISQEFRRGCCLYRERGDDSHHLLTKGFET